MKKSTLFALMLACGMAAHANETVGTLQNVSGNVSVSSEGAVARAANNMAVTDGSALLVSSNSQATLVLNNGCVVALKASQHLTVNAKQACDQVHASIKQLFPAYKSAQAGQGQLLVSNPNAVPGAGGGFVPGGNMQQQNNNVVNGFVGLTGLVVARELLDDNNSPQ